MTSSRDAFMSSADEREGKSTYEVTSCSKKTTFFVGEIMVVTITALGAQGSEM